MSVANIRCPSKVRSKLQVNPAYIHSNTVNTLRHHINTSNKTPVQGSDDTLHSELNLAILQGFSFTLHYL